jgi:carbonyl reductase 1
VFVASVCPGMIDTAASRAWFDMSRAQTPAEAAGPLLDLVLGPRPAPELYGELVRFGQRLPFSVNWVTHRVRADHGLGRCSNG